MTNSTLSYLSGFGSHWQTEALPNALPIGQNVPKRPPLGLYAEQLSGSAFTRPRTENFRSWLYRIFPSVMHGDFKKVEHLGLVSATDPKTACPNQMRWDPLPMPSSPIDFIESLQAVIHNGEPMSHQGGAVYLYAANQSMEDVYFYNADGEMLIVPHMGEMVLHTEFGKLQVTAGEIACIPRGVKFRVELITPVIMGYVCENYGLPFLLPNLGPIGANGLANPRDFQIPTAHYEDREGTFTLLNKYNQHLWAATMTHSPLNVVAWHGNYAPYKYDLKSFNTINTVSFDHPDPSIFTVLTSPTDSEGIANIDFVIFPERWMVAENTFRPPYYHRNIMSEYMGLIHGIYDAKAADFKPGGGSLHNCMSAHGPDRHTFMKASEADDKPIKQINTLAFMFESSKPWIPTAWAQETPLRQKNYMDCWQNLPKLFNSKPL